MAAPPPVLTLAVEKGPREGETRQWRAGATLRVGRVVKGNDLAVRDTGASQQHLAIEFLPPPDARWTVSDLRSSNGTLLNGAPLVPSVPAPLSHGDIINVGDSTVLAVSIEPDSDPTPRPTRSTRHAAVAAAVVPVMEEKPPLVNRRGTRKKAAAALEPSDTEKEKPDAAEMVVDEKTQVVTRRGGRKKVAAAELSGEVEEAVEATRREVRKKAVKVPEPEKDELKEATVMTRVSKRKVAEPHEQEKEEEEATAVKRRSRWKKPAELPEQVKEDDEAPVLAHHGETKKDPVSVAPVPPKTRSRRGQVRVTRGSAKDTVLEVDEEEQGGNEFAASRACTRNHLTLTAVKGGQKQKGKNVAAWDGEVEEIAMTLREEVPKGRAGTQRAASGNGASVTAAVPLEETEEVAEVLLRGRRKKAIKLPEREKEEKEKVEDVTVATRRGGLKKDTVVARCGRRKPDLETIAPPVLPVTTRSGRGQKRVTRAGQRSIVLEENDEEEQEENEVDAPRKRIRNLVNVLVVNDGEEKVNKVVARDGEAQGDAKPLEKEKPKGRANAQRVASANGASAAVVEPPEEMDNGAVATRRGGRKKAEVVTGRGRKKKDVATIAPLTLPAKTRSGRGRGRVTRASARNVVPEEDDKEDHEENEVAELSVTVNPPRAMTTNVGQEEKGHDASAKDGEAQGTASRADSGSNGIPNTTSKYREDRKLKAHSTPFDIRLDRALKKYSA